MYNGEMYVYGGATSSTVDSQIAKISNCLVHKVGTLSFNFVVGACTVAGDEIYLCFDYYGDERTCYTSNNPLGPFTEIQKSIHTHRRIKIASSNSKINQFSK